MNKPMKSSRLLAKLTIDMPEKMVEVPVPFISKQIRNKTHQLVCSPLKCLVYPTGNWFFPIFLEKSMNFNELLGYEATIINRLSIDMGVSMGGTSKWMV